MTTNQQYAEITALRKEDARFAAVYRECVDAALQRLDLGMQAFFRRIKAGETPGYPRFRPASRWRQIEFPHGNRALKLDEAQKRVRIPGVRTMPLRKGRAILPFGRAFVLEKNGRWRAVFECSREPEALPPTGKILGIDRGVHVLAATSEGELVRNGRFADRHRRVVGRHARALAAVTECDSGGRCINRHDRKRPRFSKRAPLWDASGIASATFG